MDEFVEVPSDSDDGWKERYRLVEPLELVLEFYALWDRVAQQNDWDAYREMTSEKFPSEWTWPADPESYFPDASVIPAEFIVYPIGVDDPAERHDARAFFAPDFYAVAKWLGSI